MGIDLRKTSHLGFFIIFLPAISLAIGWIFAEAFPFLPFWAETISPLAAYGILYNLFEKYLWHWPVFRTIGVVTQPDIRGRWLGSQLSSFKDQNGKNISSRVIMEVRQTFSEIKIETYYKNWQTERCIASFMTIDGQCVLFILFETSPKVQYEGDANQHKGVMRLTLLPDNHITGTYFNAEGRHGEFKFRRTTRTLHQAFEIKNDK